MRNGTVLSAAAACLRRLRSKSLAATIMAAPHTDPMDELGAIEIAKLLILIDRIDADLAERGVTRLRSGAARGVVDHRLRATRRLAEWLDRYGMTPKGRTEWAKQLAEGGLAADIARRRRIREEQP